MSLRNHWEPAPTVDGLELQIIFVLHKANEENKTLVAKEIERIKSTGTEKEKVDAMTALYNFIFWQKQLMDALITFPIIEENTYQQRNQSSIPDFIPSGDKEWITYLADKKDCFFKEIEVNSVMITSVMIGGMALVGGGGVCIFMLSSGLSGILIMGMGITLMMASVWGALAPADEEYQESSKKFKQLMYGNAQELAGAAESKAEQSSNGWLSYEKAFFPVINHQSCLANVNATEYQFSVNLEEKAEIARKAQFLTLAYYLRVFENGLHDLSKEIKLIFYKLISNRYGEDKLPKDFVTPGKALDFKTEIASVRNEFTGVLTEINKKWFAFFRGNSAETARQALHPMTASDSILGPISSLVCDFKKP